MEEELYLYKGKYFTKDILTEKYGENVDKIISERGFERAYSYKGKVFAESILKEKWGDEWENKAVEKGIIPQKKKRRKFKIRNFRTFTIFRDFRFCFGRFGSISVKISRT